MPDEGARFMRAGVKCRAPSGWTLTPRVLIMRAGALLPTATEFKERAVKR
jgi:hypothetical protein